MKEETREYLLDENVTQEEINGLSENNIEIIEEWLDEDERIVAIYKDSEELGAEHSDSDLYEEDDTDYSFGEFLLHVPDAHFIELNTGRILEFDS